MYSGGIDNGEGEHAAALVSLTKGRHDLPSGNGVLDADNVQSLTEVDWGIPDLPIGLVHHAVEDATTDGADFLLGERPEHWSPMAKVDHQSLGRLAANARLFRDPEVANARMLTLESIEKTTTLRFAVDGEPVALLSVALDSFAMAIPASAVAVTVRVGLDMGLADASTMVSGMALPPDEAPEEGYDELIVWRIYSGANSFIREAWTLAKNGVHRLLMGAIAGPCFAVGRAVRARSRSLDAERGDPTFSLRLRWAEKRIDSEKLRERLVGEAGPFGDAVVVVHGTMSNSVQFAAAVSACAPTGVTVLRFEHDTWRSLEDNATELATLVESRIQGTAVLIAHSRGGLVATRAAQRLHVRSSRTVAVVTLGTPFDGTAMAVAADVGYMGARALMGGLRLATGPVVDTVTRLLGIAVKLTPARGLQLMYPSNDALPILRDTLGHTTAAFAGRVAHDRQDYWGLASFGRGVFDAEPSDLIVPTASATHTNGQTVECDHFGYLQVPDVLNALTRTLEGLTPLPAASPTSPPTHHGSERLTF